MIHEYMDVMEEFIEIALKKNSKGSDMYVENEIYTVSKDRYIDLDQPYK